MSRPMHFEVPADDLERAKKFYANVFGWTYESWPAPMPYWLVKTGEDARPGINGGLMPRGQAGQQVVTTIAVDNLDETIRRLEANGGSIQVPKMAVPGIGWMVYFADSEGNSWGAMQMDAAAS